MDKLKTHSAIYIAQTIIERMDLISGTHSTEYTWQTFYMFTDFR